MTSYQQWLKQHLATYKVQRLGVRANGVWRRNQQSYAHILPEALSHLNILEPYRAAFWHDFMKQMRITLHPDFHHLNSSQAMCFNLFYPLLTNLPILTAVLGVPQTIVSAYAFEHISDPTEGTNFDFYLRLNSGTQLFFELKLSETGFGTAQNNLRRHRKLETVYAPRLRHHVDDACLNPIYFFQHYQLLRNISYLNHGTPDMLFLIFPFQNTRLLEEGTSIVSKVKPPVHNKIRLIDLEVVVDDILQAAGREESMLREHFLHFQEKYIGRTQQLSRE